MKSFLFVFMAAFLAFTTVPSSLPNIACSIQEYISDYIVMEDDIMLRTITDGSNGDIVQIEILSISSQPVFSVSGCNSNDCLTNLSTLNKDTYSVKVTTSFGYTFTGSITLQ